MEDDAEWLALPRGPGSPGVEFRYGRHRYMPVETGNGTKTVAAFTTEDDCDGVTFYATMRCGRPPSVILSAGGVRELANLLYSANPPTTHVFGDRPGSRFVVFGGHMFLRREPHDSIPLGSHRIRRFVGDAVTRVAEYYESHAAPSTGDSRRRCIVCVKVDYDTRREVRDRFPEQPPALASIGRVLWSDETPDAAGPFVSVTRSGPDELTVESPSRRFAVPRAVFERLAAAMITCDPPPGTYVVEADGAATVLGDHDSGVYVVWDHRAEAVGVVTGATRGLAVPLCRGGGLPELLARASAESPEDPLPALGRFLNGSHDRLHVQ